MKKRYIAGGAVALGVALSLGGAKAITEGLNEAFNRVQDFRNRDVQHSTQTGLALDSEKVDAFHSKVRDFEGCLNVVRPRGGNDVSFKFDKNQSASVAIFPFGKDHFSVAVKATDSKSDVTTSERIAIDLGGTFGDALAFCSKIANSNVRPENLPETYFKFEARELDFLGS